MTHSCLLKSTSFSQEATYTSSGINKSSRKSCYKQARNLDLDMTIQTLKSSHKSFRGKYLRTESIFNLSFATQGRRMEEWSEEGEGSRRIFCSSTWFKLHHSFRWYRHGIYYFKHILKQETLTNGSFDIMRRK